MTRGDTADGETTSGETTGSDTAGGYTAMTMPSLVTRVHGISVVAAAGLAGAGADAGRRAPAAVRGGDSSRSAMTGVAAVADKTINRPGRVIHLLI